jgi:hypothetical protein
VYEVPQFHHQIKGGLHHGPCSRADVPLERRNECHEPWTMNERTPDQCHEMPAGLEHAVHFAHGLTSIGKLLESELTEDNVEERIWVVLQHLLPTNLLVGNPSPMPASTRKT